MLKWIFCLLLLIAPPLMAESVHVPLIAAAESLADTPPHLSLLSRVALLAGLSLLPFAIMLLTSFLKIVVVLSLLRSALGVQNTPPSQVLNGIALLVTI
jgi:type III secretion protein R